MRKGAEESTASEPAVNDLVHPLDKSPVGFLTFRSETDPFMTIRILLKSDEFLLDHPIKIANENIVVDAGPDLETGLEHRPLFTPETF